MLLLPFVFAMVLVGMFMLDGDVGFMAKFFLFIILAGSVAIRVIDPALVWVGAVVQAILCIGLVFRMKITALQ